MSNESEMVDCEKWEPIGDSSASDPCGTCGAPGTQHRPTPFLRGLGISHDDAEAIRKATLESLRRAFGGPTGS